MYIALAIAIALLFVIQPQLLMAQATTITTNVEMPVNQTVTDCNGQPVILSGTVHMVVHSTTDANGSTHVTIHSNYQDVSGTSPSGITYRGVNSVETTFNSSGPQSEVTTVDNVLLVSQGSTDNLRISATAHITINANGVATAQFTRLAVTCNG
ncbi:MAG: hypothetical protein LC754_11725 [Acidobacteria bacterium]|nr:hypothetical protein [Acidobacteriota bacterium]